MKVKVLIGALIAAASLGAQAAPVSTGGVFNMYSQKGLDTLGVVSGEPINVDTTITGFVDMVAGTWGVASTTPFYGLTWTASGGQLITTPGSYVLNTTTGVITTGSGPVASDGMMYFNVGAGQAAGAINFAWGATTGIRVVNVWNVNPNGSLTAAVVPGMENGPFPGFNAAFNLTSAGLVPEPETYAMMLAGLGLLGLAVRRRNSA